MFVIRERHDHIYWGFRGWSPAFDEATQFETREEATALGEERCQLRNWIVVEVPEPEDEDDDRDDPTPDPRGETIMPADEKLFEVPNLDDLSVDPEDYFRLANVLAVLTQYAMDKQAALRFRLAGNVEAARLREDRMQDLYDSLPEWARW